MVKSWQGNALEGIVHDLGIVIVNWNTREFLRRCLDTVVASRGIDRFRTIVVDNASDDGSVDMVRQRFPQVEVIENDANIGYPGANNVGLRHLGFHAAGDLAESAPRYALLLNPDTELPQNALAQMVQFMDSRPGYRCRRPQTAARRWQPGQSLSSRFSHAIGQLLSLFRIGQAIPSQQSFRKV